MVNKRIAQRYAKAIFDLAIEQQVLENIKDDMAYLSSLSKVKEFYTMLVSPVIPLHKKQAVCEEILNKNVHKMAAAFVTLIIRKKRSYALPAIAEEFVELYNNYKKILPVKIYTAIPMDKKIREQIIEKIKKQTSSNQVTLNEDVDEALIGGFVLRYKDKLYDASIRRQLSELRKELV